MRGLIRTLGDNFCDFCYFFKVETKKEEKFRLVEESVLESVSKIGRSLNISLVSKKSHVSRAWIYKYFGNDADAIIIDSIKSAGRRFAELDKNLNIETIPQLLLHYKEIILLILKDAEEYPWIPDLYFRFFGQSCEIGMALREIELEFSNHLERHCLKLGLDKMAAKETSIFLPKSIMAAAFAIKSDSTYKALGLEKITDHLCSKIESAFKL